MFFLQTNSKTHFLERRPRRRSGCAGLEVAARGGLVQHRVADLVVLVRAQLLPEEQPEHGQVALRSDDTQN